MLQTVIALEIGAGPADDAVAGGIRIPAAIPALVSISAASARCRLAIRYSPNCWPISITAGGGTPGSKTRATREFSLAFVGIVGGPLRQCSRAGQRGCRNHDRAKNC